MPSKSSWILVVVVNLLPAAGVLFFGWDAFTVVFLYWLENLVIGVMNVLKIALAAGGPGHATVEAMRRQGVPDQELAEWSAQQQKHLAAARTMTHGSKIALIPFFCVHYGLFMLVHLVFIFVLLRGGPGNPNVDWRTALSDVLSPGILIALAMLVWEHAYEFYTGYWKNGKYRETFAPLQMFAPYGRIVVIHVAILAGGFLFVALNLPKLMVLVLVALKIGFELAALKLRALAAAKAAAEPSTGIDEPLDTSP